MAQQLLATRRNLTESYGPHHESLASICLSLASIYNNRFEKKAMSSVRDSSHPADHKFQLLRSGKRYRSMAASSERQKASFFPTAIRTLNECLVMVFWSYHCTNAILLITSLFIILFDLRSQSEFLYSFYDSQYTVHDMNISGACGSTS